MAKEWQLAKKPAPSAVKSLSGYSDLVSRLLFYRGVKNKTVAEKFLNPNYETDLHDPFLMKDMDRAAKRVLTAIEYDERIIIFGDYDADGVPGTAIMATFFNQIGFTNYEAYIPDRHNEAYGLNSKAIEKFANSGAKLIITVDCGITNFEEVVFADKLGIEVIITDHHLAPEKIPPAYAVVDAKQNDDQYPFKMLSGAAVAFKLVLAISKLKDFNLVPGWEKWLLDLVAISTITDMVTLEDENRTLAFFGLKVLRQTKRLGLVNLLAVAKIDGVHITEDDVGFMIGPRLNSASRMSHADDAFSLIMTKDQAEARAIADQLEKQNKGRREIVEKIIQDVARLYDSDNDSSKIIVMGSPEWGLGVLGLASSRLVEKYAKPVFLWSKNGNGEIKGSCRSDGSINVVELMRAVGPDFFIDLGGHAMAGGFSLLPEREAELAVRLNGALEKIPQTEVEAIIIAEAELTIDDINRQTADEVLSLAPFGVGNPKPIFLLRDLSLTEVKSFGNGGLHLELKFTKNDGSLVTAIGFFMCKPTFFAEKFDSKNGHKFSEVDLAVGRRVDLLASIEKSYFRGREEIRLRIVDVRHPK
ncbi:MAG: single-stranded-DNA-specific exonuclease RecJ [Candidatus Paceibacterota bacterium]|jgi:single-stranded-DNA-specific exonuclease